MIKRLIALTLLVVLATTQTVALAKYLRVIASNEGAGAWSAV